MSIPCLTQCQFSLHNNVFKIKLNPVTLHSKPFTIWTLSLCLVLYLATAHKSHTVVTQHFSPLRRLTMPLYSHWLLPLCNSFNLFLYLVNFHSTFKIILKYQLPIFRRIIFNLFFVFRIHRTNHYFSTYMIAL